MGIYHVYQKAGKNYLAYRLEKLFVEIKTEKDKVLHNQILEEILEITRGKEQSFFESLADTILNKKVDKKRRLLIRVAEIILGIGQNKVVESNITET